MVRLSLAVAEKSRRVVRPAAWSFSARRRRIHSRPSASTSSSNSRSESPALLSEFIS
jgi:hypothetical protein